MKQNWQKKIPIILLFLLLITFINQPAMPPQSSKQPTVSGVSNTGLREITFDSLLTFPLAMVLGIQTVDGNNLLAQVDKKTQLGDYMPSDLMELSAFGAKGKMLRALVIPDLAKMLTQMSQEELSIKILSAYRSFNRQKTLFNYYLRLFGISTYRFSAEPGHSEHQLGTTIDFGIGNSRIDFTTNFAYTREGQWLNEHAWKYGFVHSYPKDKEEITGYIYEPWHYRYIGIENASNWHDSGLTLTEFLQEENFTKPRW